MRLNGLTRYLTYQLYHALLLLGSLKEEQSSEEIHEFRVALRRVRSLTGLYLKHNVPFPDELKAAVKRTNPVRELDVLIDSLRKSDYPKTYASLVRIRKKYFDALFTPSFRSETAQSLRVYYDTLCDADPELSPHHLIQTVDDLYAKCVQRYCAIDDTTSQKELHRLRVQFKNARYGLEFLDAADIHNERKKITECKKRQNTLGAIQDAYNQITWLKQIVKNRPHPETKRLLKERKKMLKVLKAANRSVLCRAS